MRRPALLLVLLIGACDGTSTPTRDELARALGAHAPAAPTDLTHIACQALGPDPVTYACRWRQRDGRAWHGWAASLSAGADGWHLRDVPARRP